MEKISILEDARAGIGPKESKVKRSSIAGVHKSLGTVNIRVLDGGCDLEDESSTNAESVLYVISGRGDISVDGYWRPFKQGWGVYYPFGSKRRVTNSIEDQLVMLEVFSAAGDSSTGQAVKMLELEKDGGGVLETVGGYVGMGVHWLATNESVGSKKLVLATSTFDDGGTHQLHRHVNADEFFMLLDGRGELHLEDGSIRQSAGELVYLKAGEWHGFTTDPGVITSCVYGYLGAGNLESAGYEVKQEVVQ